MSDHILLLPHHFIPQNNFLKTRQQIEISQYQLYAVEKWILERRQHHLLVVYTGHPHHNITLDAFQPNPDLSSADAQAAWDTTIALLRADGAKPKQTPYGILMVTSLAHFRSDYTIVQIPAGNYLQVKDQLYTNINLLRMGCSGRSALTLEDPSDTTKERFISAYHLPENTVHCLPSFEGLPLPPPLIQSHSYNNSPGSSSTKPIPQTGLAPANTQPWRSPEKPLSHSSASLPTRPGKEKALVGKTKDPATFIPTVLELVKLVQAGLAIFGMYGSDPSSPLSVPPNIALDGLLCDHTVQAIRNWTAQVGAPCVGLGPTDRIADPLFVSALLSLVLATRNKLAYLGYSAILPRDPFLYPHAFSVALTAYIQSTAPPSITPAISTALSPPTNLHHHHHTLSSPHHAVHVSTPLIPSAPPPTNLLSAAAAAAAAAATSTSSPPLPNATLAIGAILTRDTVDAISTSYDAKLRKVRHVLKNKLSPSAPGIDSDGAEASGVGGADRDHREHHHHHRRNTLSLMSLSGGEEQLQQQLPATRSTLSQSGGAGPVVVGAASPPTVGGQLLSGIASGLRGGSAALAGVGGDGGMNGDPAALMAPTADLAGFVLFVVGKGGRGGSRHIRDSAPGGGGGGVSRPRGKAKRMSRDLGGSGKRESVDFGLGLGLSGGGGAGNVGYAYAHALQERERDGVVGGSVKALWSGRVVELVRMREEVEAMLDAGLGLGGGGATNASSSHLDGKRWRGGLAGGGERDSRRDRAKRGTSPSGVASDGDESCRDGVGAGARQYDGRSTEEESDAFPNQTVGAGGSGSVHSFGGMWGGRVRGKLETWTGLGRKKQQSVDLSANSSALSASQHAKGKEKEKEKEASPQLPSQPQTSQQQQPQPQLSRLAIGSGFMSRRASSTGRSTMGSRTQSPTLPPMVFSMDAERDPDDDDLLSSGQVSPLSDSRPNPFSMLTHTASGASSSTNLAGLSAQEYERTLTKFLSQKRPWARRRLTPAARVASWADPVSARDSGGGERGGEEGMQEDEAGQLKEPAKGRAGVSDEEVEEESDVSRNGAAQWKRKEKARFHSLLSVVDDSGVLVEEPLESSDYEEDDEAEEEYNEEGVVYEAKAVGFDPRRRRSFHDLDTFRNIEVLSPERMGMDVELCGELLTMWRREEHLRNVIACVRLFSGSLSNTNTSLREHYESHQDVLQEINDRSIVLAELDVENVKVSKIFQATNTLRYESEQFSTHDLWQTASPSRRKVFELREKVFGAGGRRLRAGVHGAHGPYNRLQWTLDGQERLVDQLGRTESEAEEESGLERVAYERPPEAAEVSEEDMVAHPIIKPMWLLRFFTSWGARWSAATSGAAVPAVVGTVSGKEDEQKETPSPASVGAEKASGSLSPASGGEKQIRHELDRIPSRSASH
ncbi:hypothetical protein BDZ97DRAFT_33783 [Flammula alnicola]|nr:hypothetical protein BDZ97DRAFT_33783 [Flammula alnicola]